MARGPAVILASFGATLLLFAGASSATEPPAPTTSRSAAPRETPPNVVFLIADDASCHFGETYGCRWAKTPAIDRLARGGIAFDGAYVPTSKCSPCRAALLTGRNPWQLEAAANHWPVFPPRFMAFTEVLAARGVACGAAGKIWSPGNALDAAGTPRTWGLQPAGGRGVGPGEAFRDFRATRRPGQPFFFWFGSKKPHRRYEPDAGLAAGKKTADIDRVPAFWPDTETVRRDMLDYATEIEAFDREVAAILEAVTAAGEAENTLVIVTSDHGMPFPRVKGHTFDVAHRVPLVMHWPRGIVRPGRRVAALTSLIDIAPTILDLFAIDGVAAGMRPITGTSLADLLADAPSRPRDHVILGRERNDARARRGAESGLGYPARAIRRGDLFYVHNFAPDRWPCGDPDLGLADTDAGPTKGVIEAAGEGDRFWQLCFGKRPADELYDLAADPDCVRNLAAEAGHRADVDRLKAALFAELERQEDPRVLGRGDVFDTYHSPQKAPAGWSTTPTQTRP
jgi:N-sulfoglucosamine sulfohydrolase